MRRDRTERRARRQRGRGAGKVVLGFYLMLIGALVFAANVGIDVPHGVWNYWPFLLIAGGGVRMIYSRSFDEGYWLLLAGLYCWVSTWNLLGLTWGTAWPIFLVAGGLSMVLEPWLGDGRKRSDPASGTGREGEADRVL